MKIIRLTSICSPKQWRTIPTKDLLDEGYPVYGANGVIGYCKEYNHTSDTIIIGCRGSCGNVNIARGKSYINGNAMCLDDLSSDVDILYLYYFLQNYDFRSVISGTTIPQVTKQGLEKIDVVVSSKENQREIVRQLQLLDSIIEERHKELRYFDALIKSRFIEMFGDPVTNLKGWTTKPLLDMGNCKNGMNFHTGDSGMEMHCLGVGDFKDLSFIDGTDHLPVISLNEAPPEESMLRDGDIVFVRSNGNKALVGRCLVVYPRSTPTTYSGFCIRYRLTSSEVDTTYLLRVLKTDSMRKKMTGRGANIQNLNQQILAALDIPLPPIELQQAFAAFVEQVDKSKFEIQQSLEKLEILKKSLMQQYFG